MAFRAINPAFQLALCEFKTAEYEARSVGLENDIDEWTQMDDESGIAKTQLAALRIQLNLIRALIAFWRGQASYWKSDLNEIKTALRESNKLSGQA
jgi:uncharacterized protein HemX